MYQWRCWLSVDGYVDWVLINTWFQMPFWFSFGCGLKSLISLIDLHSLSARIFKKYNPEKSDSDVDDFELCM